MPLPFLFSLECELALGRDGPARPMNYPEAYIAIGRGVRAQTPWLPDGGPGIFTPGFRFYLDTGCHPEMALAEVASPGQLLALKRASFAVLGEALRAARGAGEPGLVLLANNHDYTTGAVWGCHENYAVSRPFADLQRGMVPFLASRHIFTGNGRLGPRGRVLFSTRAQAMSLTSGGSTTDHRALFSTCRNEPLMARGRFTGRLHLICGDTLRSDLGEYLKVATTALVLAWLEADPFAADDLWHPTPLRLLRAANVMWTPPGRLHVSPAALRLQRAYWGRVERFVGRTHDLPAWCADAVRLWDETLRLLETDPLALSDRLDPFIKLGLFDAVLESLGRTWSDVASDPELYARLALVDVAYHRVGDDGPFEQLEREGVLAHRVPHDGPTPDPAASPGAALTEVVSALPTRAAARAALIAELSGEQHEARVGCNWNTIWRASPPGLYGLDDPLSPVPPPFCAEPARRRPFPPVPGSFLDPELRRPPGPPPAEPAAPEGGAAAARATLLQRLRRILIDRESA